MPKPRKSTTQRRVRDYPLSRMTPHAHALLGRLAEETGRSRHALLEEAVRILVAVHATDREAVA